MLIGLVFCVFGQTVGYDWVNVDDPIHVLENPLLHPITGASLRQLWTTAYASLYVPAAYTLFAGEVVASQLVFGGTVDSPLNPHVFHAVSVALHAINVLLVWKLLAQLNQHKPRPAAFGAALFAIHPLQVESVAWISEQRGLLSSTFSLAALVLHVRGARAERQPVERWWFAAVATVCFGVALLAKPQAVAVAIVAFLIDVCLLRAAVWTAGLKVLPWFLLAGIVAVVTRGLQTGVDGEGVIPLWQRPIIVGDSLFFYASKLLLPVDLCIDYGRTPRTVVIQPMAWVAAIAVWIGLAGIASLPQLQRCRLPVSLFVITLLPVLGFVPFLFQSFSTVADRYAYMALLGPALALARIEGASMPGRRLPVIVGCLSLVLLAGLSFKQAWNWRDAVALNERALQVNPESFLGACNLGSALINAAIADPNMLPMALPWLKMAVEARPADVTANLTMGIALEKLGRLDEATWFYETVLLQRPMHAEANNYLGVIHARQGRVTRATEYFRRALLENPEYREAVQNLHRAYELLEAQSPIGIAR